MALHLFADSGWACDECRAPWPCQQARLSLRREYAGRDADLLAFLADQMTRYAIGVPDPQFTAEGGIDGITDRFINWAKPNSPPST